MTWKHDPATTRPARVLLVSQRAAEHQVSRALQFELEDFVRAVDAADLVAAGPGRLTPWVLRRVTAIASRFPRGSWYPVGGARPAVGEDHDLVMVNIESLHDLERARSLAWLLSRARTSICLVDEVWKKGLERRTGELRLLRQFDRILVRTAGAADSVAELTGRPTSFIAPSVDALALCPYPAAPARTIDVYSMGRRSPATHASLLEVADRRGWFYLYDTMVGTGAPDHRQHRRHLADLLKRTRFFLAYAGKMDAPEETGGQEEIGFRYFEGAAAGAVLVGAAPANPWFERLFGWRDAILPLKYGATDPAELVAALDLPPEREQTIRRTNVIESLRRHDHVYRWAEVLRLVSLPETPAMEQRRHQLSALADEVARGARLEASVGRVAGS